MALTQNQPKTGHLDEESPNTVNRTGRDDGFGSNQPKTGHLDEDSPPSPGAKTGRDDGFNQNQDNTGYMSEDSPPSKGSPSSTPVRTDEVRDI